MRDHHLYISILRSAGQSALPLGLEERFVLLPGSLGPHLSEEVEGAGDD